MNVTYNNKPAIMRRNGRLVLGDTGGITFQFIALDIDSNELGTTEQIKVESVSTETTTEVEVRWIKPEPSLKLMDYQIVQGNFLPNDEIELTSDRQFVKDIKNTDVKTFFDNQPYADSVEAFMTLRLDNDGTYVYGNYLYTYEIITPFEFFVLKQNGAYTFDSTGDFRLTGTLKSPAFIGEKSGDTETNSQFVIMLIDMKSAKCYFQKTKEINGELGILKFDDTFNGFGLLGIIKRGNVLGNNTYEFVATPDFEGLSNEVDIDCYGTFPTAEMDFNYGITINPIEKSIIFIDVSDSPSGEWDETDWGYKNGVWGYDKNGTRVADDRIRTVGGITTKVALSDEAYAFWQKNTTIQLATPQNVTANGTTVSWDLVENATSYDVYADDTTLLGNVTSQQSVDLTTLSGWANLTDGNHTIQIVAKAAGYIDSEKSAGVEVTKSASPKTLEESTWAEIAQVSANKSWDAMGWKVGDSKTITLNGTVGTLALDNYQCKVYILGFDHNAEKEGQGISFGMLEGVDGKQLCLTDQYYSKETATSEVMAFTMYTTKTSAGGWKTAKMRKITLGSTDVENGDATPNTLTNPVPNTLMAALPADLRAILKPITKYTDNVGAGSTESSAVTSTIDYLPLMAPFEVSGAVDTANSSEEQFQAQYEYYKGEMSIIKCKQSDIASPVNWWLRSPDTGSDYMFTSVDEYGQPYCNDADISSGLAPVFLV